MQKRQKMLLTKMTLDEYIESDDKNVFWKLSDGERQNLLDEAIERLLFLRAEIAIHMETIRISAEIIQQQATEKRRIK